MKESPTKSAFCEDVVVERTEARREAGLENWAGGALGQTLFFIFEEPSETIFFRLLFWKERSSRFWKGKVHLPDEESSR